jgi:FMN phosphatase YigB (HAD superfamily)
MIFEKWRNYLREQEGEEARIVTFDFDDTLIRYDSDWEYKDDNNHIIDLFKRFYNAGYKVFIVTTRLQKHEASPDRINVAQFVKEHNLPVAGVIFTEGEDKVHTLQDLNSLLHFDDDDFEWAAIEQKAPHIKIVKINYQTGDIIDGLQHIKEMGI